MSAIIIPRNPRLTEFAREREYWWLHNKRLSENDIRRSLGLPLLDSGDRVIPAIAGGASFTDYLELKVLDYIFNDPATAFVSADPYLGLWQSTATLTDTSTGSTANECVSPANYTGYARQQIPNTSMSAAAAGSKTNGTAIQFAPCTANSATVTYWGTCDALTVGNMLVWGTCTSTTIDTSHTPATVAIGGLVVTLD